MKQTNSAIKFLLAQYRAIFKNANLKMFLAAATAAAAMAASQSSAAAATTPNITIWDNIPEAEANPTELTGNDQKDNDTLKIAVSAADETNTKGFNLKLTSGSHSISGAAAGHELKSTEGKTTSITLNGDATNTSLAIGGSGATDYVTVSIDTLNNEQGKVTITGSGDQALSVLNAKSITIGKEAGKDAVVEVGAFGSLGGKSTTLLQIKAGGKLSFVETANEHSKATATGGVQMLDGTISVAAGGKGTVNGLTVTKGTIELAGDAAKSGGLLTVDGDLVMNGGTADLQAQTSGGALTVKGKTTVNAGAEIKVGSGGVFTMEGDAKFAAGTVKDTSVNADGKVSVGTVTGTRTITIGSADLKNLLAGTFEGSGSDANAVLKVKLSDSGDAALDLEKAGIVSGDGTSKLVLTTNGIATVVGNNAEFKKGEFKTKTGYDFNTLTVGAGGDKGKFALNGGSVVTVHKALNVAGTGDTALTISGSTLNLDGTGTVSAKTITLNDSATDAKNLATNLNVDSGEWNVTNLTLTKGNVSVKNGATLNIKGKLAIDTGALGTVTADASKIKLVEENSKLSVKKANTVELKNTAELTVKAGDIFTTDDSGVVTVNSTDFIKNAIKADATSVLNLSGAGTLSKAELKKLVDGVGFGGVISGVSLADADKPEDGSAITEDMAGSDAYKDVQVKVGTDAIAKSYSVDSVVLDKAATEMNIGANGSMTLNGPKINMFVSKDGQVAGVKMTDANSNLVLAGSGKIGDVDAQTAGNGKLTVGAQDQGGNVVIGAVGKTAALGAVTVNENVDLTATGDIKTQNFIFNGKALHAEGKTLTVGGAQQTVEIMGDVDAKALVIDSAQGEVTIAGNSLVELGSLEVSGSNQTKPTIFVGVDGDASTSSTATLEVDNLKLSGGALIVDPDWSLAASVANIKAMGGTSGADEAIQVDGKIGVGQNAVVGFGFENSQAIKDLLTGYGYMDADGKMVKDKLPGALVLNKKLEIANNQGVLIDPSQTGTALKGTLTSTSTVFQNKFEMNKGGALVITDNVYTILDDGTKSGSAVTFKSSTSGTVAATDGKVILAGDFDANDKNITIFTNATGTTGIDLVSANGLITAKLDASGKIDQSTWKFNEQELKNYYLSASAPVQELLRNKMMGKIKGNELGVKFLGEVANSTDHSGVLADAAAHAATYAGAQQAAVAAVTTMAVAVGGRVGSLGAEATAITATGSQANGGVWVSPMYKSFDADGFNAQGASYGADVDLAGVSFGADTVNGNMRFGAVFNIGSGDADGKGNGAGLKDEFDYYGFGIYSAMGFGNFALVGDASMNVISHDVEGHDLHGEADTTAVTMGITGQYTFASPMMDVTPHLGARFIRLDTESYDLLTGGEVLATTDFDVQNVFSIPVGVSLSKAFEMGGWALAPSADFSITFNTGDTEAKSTTAFTGVQPIGLTTEVLDEVTYGVALGLGAQYGAFGTNIGINYTGSENTDSFGVNAQARYMF